MQRNLFLFSICLFLSCGKTSIDYEALAKAYCNCGQASIDISNQMQELMEQNKSEAFERLASNASNAFKEAMECSTAARQEYGELKLDKEKLGKQILKDCPNMPPKFVMDLLEKIN